jgi:DUF971 family protein
MQPQPTEVHLKEKEGILEITWDDDRHDTFALSYLRGWCPCASCQGHFSMKKTFIEGVSTELVDVEPVGGYAMRLKWADGHSTGIYSFEYLRKIAESPPDEGPSNQQCLSEIGQLH